MKHNTLAIYVIVVSFLVLFFAFVGPSEAEDAVTSASTVSTVSAPIGPDNPLGQRGTVCFQLHTDKTYKNGLGQEMLAQLLLELPGYAAAYLERTDVSVDIFFLWAMEGFNRGFQFQLQELPGPQDYFFIFTWDADQGFCDGYMNGISMRLPGTRFAPWTITNQATAVTIPAGPNTLSNLLLLPVYTPPTAISALVPAHLLGKDAALMAGSSGAAVMDIEKRKGKLLYASPLDSSESVKNWVLEGPGDIRFAEGKMIMRSLTPEPPIRGQGHFNYWCPQEFPDSFVAEWEYEPLEDYGFSIIHFAATGVNGEDVFDPSLPKRDGTYHHYVQGAITNYYISYFANLKYEQTGRTYCNMRKNNQFYIIQHGPIAVKPTAKRFHRLRLVKDGAHMQLTSDGKVCIDVTDPGTTPYGPVLGKGKISFRQMSITAAAYRNFSVWELRKE